MRRLQAETSRLKRLALLIALVTVASSARASGMGIRWGSCDGTSNRNFACDVTTGAELLVVSFSPPPGVVELTGVAAWGHFTSAGNDVPTWWQLSPSGGCRMGALSVSFVLDDQTDCDDPWQGQGMGGIASIRSDGQGVEFLVAVAVPEGLAQPAQPGRTCAAFKMYINHRRSSGPGSCTGCSTPMCITLDKMALGQPNKNGLQEIDLTDGMGGMGGPGNVATWQGGTPTCGAGAAKPATWTELKRHFK